MVCNQGEHSLRTSDSLPFPNSPHGVCLIIPVSGHSLLVIFLSFNYPCFWLGSIFFFSSVLNRVGKTLMNAFLFNTALIMLSAVVVTQFTSDSFSLYVNETSIGGREPFFSVITFVFYQVSLFPGKELTDIDDCCLKYNFSCFFFLSLYSLVRHLREKSERIDLCVDGLLVHSPRSIWSRFPLTHSLSEKEDSGSWYWGSSCTKAHLFRFQVMNGMVSGFLGSQLYFRFLPFSFVMLFLEDLRRIRLASFNSPSSPPYLLILICNVPSMILLPPPLLSFCFLIFFIYSSDSQETIVIRKWNQHLCVDFYSYDSNFFLQQEVRELQSPKREIEEKWRREEDWKKICQNILNP